MNALSANLVGGPAEVVAAPDSIVGDDLVVGGDETAGIFYKEPDAPKSEENKTPEVLEELPKFEPFKIFTLANPVMHVEGDREHQVKAIRLRSPNGLDLFECGAPPGSTVWTKGGMSVAQDMERLKVWVTRLSGAPLNLFYKIPARDLRAMQRWINDELNAGN